MTFGIAQNPQAGVFILPDGFVFPAKVIFPVSEEGKIVIHKPVYECLGFLKQGLVFTVGVFFQLLQGFISLGSNRFPAINRMFDIIKNSKKMVLKFFQFLGVGLGVNLYINIGFAYSVRV